MAEIKEIDKFHIFQSEFKCAAVHKGQFITDGKPEIALIGRSNVGKSSLINSLCGSRKLARVSREPGKTRTINYYAITSRTREEEGDKLEEWYLVDLPGYGFAKTSQENRDTWSAFIADYIQRSPDLALLCLLIDARHPGLPIDLKAYEWLSSLGLEIQVIGTKGDKLKNSELKKNKKELARLFPSAYPPVIYSTLSGNGKDELLSVLEKCVTR